MTEDRPANLEQSSGTRFTFRDPGRLDPSPSAGGLAFIVLRLGLRADQLLRNELAREWSINHLDSSPTRDDVSIFQETPPTGTRLDATRVAIPGCLYLSRIQLIR